MTCTTYCEKIEEVFDGMIRLAHEALPENRREVNKYIARVWTNTVVFVQSIKRDKGTEELRSKFEPYVTSEEARLQRNLEDIKYDIDTYDTVQLIAGEGRAEMVIKTVYVPVSCTRVDLPLDSFADVISRFEERSGKDKPRSKTRPLRFRAI